MGRVPHDTSGARDMAGFFARHARLLLLASAYAAIATFVLPPTGDVPAFDDWDYAFTAQVLADSGELRQSDVPAMTLVVHVTWGALFLQFLGDSWLALRVSTIVMSWIGGLSLYSIWRQQGWGAGRATVACGAFVFCPLVFCLSYTFMTDVAGTSMPLLFVACAAAAMRREPIGRGAWIYVALGVLGALCYLTRQTAAIPAIAFGAVYGVGCLLKSPGLRWRSLFAFVVGAMATVGAHLLTSGPGREGVSLDFALLGNVKGLFAKALSIVLETAALLLPVSLPMLFRSRVRTTDFRWGRWICLAVFVGAIVFLAPVIRPYRGFELFDAGVRAPTPVLAWDHTRESLLFSSGGKSLSVFHVGMLIAGAGSAWILVTCGVESVAAGRAAARDPVPLLLVSVIALSLAGYLGLLLVIEWVFDRYIILAVGLAIAGAAFLRPEVRPNRLATGLAAACLALNALLAVVLTQESMAVNASAWQAYESMVKDGIPPQDIAVGIPNWNGYFWAPGRDGRAPAQQFFDSIEPRVAGRSTAAPHWRIAARAAPGWEVARTIATAAWFREKQLLVLHRANDPESSASPP